MELIWTSFLAMTFCSWFGPIPFSHISGTAIVFCFFFLNLIFFQAEQVSLTLFLPKCHPVNYIFFTEYESLWGKYTLCRTWNTLEGNIVKLILKNNLQLVPTTQQFPADMTYKNTASHLSHVLSHVSISLGCFIYVFLHPEHTVLPRGTEADEIINFGDVYILLLRLCEARRPGVNLSHA